VVQVRTTAKRDGEDWVINGSKIYITNGCGREASKPPSEQVAV
jgi:alkylation response protein AidB-like acyl-CoA dehydrogenase